MAKLSVDKALLKAKSRAKKGDIAEAQKLYQAVLQVFPQNKRAHQGLAALNKLKPPSATQGPPQEVINQLINLYNQGQLGAVVEQAKALTNQYPEAFIIWNILGAANKRLGRVQVAAEAFKQVTDINPTYADGFSNLGATLQEQGKLEEAITSYKKALSLKPDYAEAYNNMGNALKEQGKLDEAIVSYQKALSLKPDYAEAYNNMGNALKGQGKLDEAIVFFNKALSLTPDYAEAYNNMGNALQEQGKLDEAIVSCQKALSLTPDYAEAYNNMGNALQEQGKLEEAIVSYQKALSLKPDYAEAYNNMGNALKGQDKLDEAIVSYQKALSVKPDYAEAYNNKGNALKGHGKLDEAIVSYQKALSLKPDYAEAYNNMGNALKEQEKLDEAIVSYQKALSLKPDYADASHLLSSLTGKTTNSAPTEYVENLFDGYASKFDQSLVVDLEYRIPKLLTDIIIKEHGSGTLGSVLDLGCGTGLTGLEIKDFCSNLEGIDLSKKMLELANAKNVYDQLSHSDIIEYLSNEELNFDYFISSDVFVYMGELSDVFRLIKSKNKRAGKLVFSTEHTELDGFKLEKTGRYSHSKTYIEELCAKFEYTISHFSMVNLRKEKGQFLTGGLYVLDF